MEDCWRSRGDTNITESAQSYLYPLHFLLFYLLLLKEISSISSNTTSNTTRVKTGIKQHAKMENCGARTGDTNITEPAQGYVYPLFFCSLAEGNIVDII